jgi:choline dehydrogenase
MELYYQKEAGRGVSTLAPYASNLVRKGLVGLEWMLTREGLGASNQFEACAFLKSSPEQSYPDIQFQ